MFNLSSKDDREKLEDLNQSGIYVIRNIENNKVYVGSAVNLNRRWKHHKYYLKKKNHRNILLQRTFDQHGIIIFKFEILEYVTEPVKLLEREAYWMDKLECHNRDKGYNLVKTPTSQFGIKRNPEVGLKISKANKGKIISSETKNKMSAAKLGTKKSEETKAKMSSAAKGRIHSKEALAKQSAAKKGRKFSDKFKEMRRQIQTGKILSEETKRKMSETHKKRHAEKNQCIISQVQMIDLNLKKE